jgi:hypothetical protein
VSKLRLLVVAATIGLAAVGAGWKWGNTQRHAMQQHKIAGWTWEAPIAANTE